jgi:hypothetical protein
MNAAGQRLGRGGSVTSRRGQDALWRVNKGAGVPASTVEEQKKESKRDFPPNTTVANFCGVVVRFYRSVVDIAK